LLRTASDQFHAAVSSELVEPEITDYQQEEPNMLERLTPFVGTWDLEPSFPTLPGARGQSVFEWALDGRFLIQRTEISVPEAPDSHSVIGVDPRGGSFAQHYFDSRGVVRVYAMTFEDGVWTLRRESPDFSDLNFWQRYTGKFSDDGDTIDGHWDISHDEGATWAKDFDLVYRRVA
jgi:hypothetical protein